MPDGLDDYLKSFKKPKQGDDSVATVLDDEFSKLGYGDNARLSILGDVGRENNWNRNTIFKGHLDPKNKAYNRGIISWQGDRQANLNNHLKKEGVYGKNNDDELRGMARFMDKELQSPEFAPLRQKLLNAKTTYDASDALQKYIKYVPQAPYNSPDPEFKVKNNADWAKRARNLGLGQQGLNSYLDQFTDSGAVSEPSDDGLTSYLDSFKDSTGGQPLSPTVQNVVPVQPYPTNQPLPAPATDLVIDMNGGSTSDEIAAKRLTQQVPGFAEEVIPPEQQPYDIPPTEHPNGLLPDTAQVRPQIQSGVKGSNQPKSVPARPALDKTENVDVKVSDETYDEQGNIIPNDPRTVSQVRGDKADNAVADTIEIETTGKDGQTLAKEALTALAPKYGIDVNAVLAANPNLTITPTANGKIDLTYGDLARFGVDINPLIRDKIAKSRIEDPQPDLRVGKDWTAQDAQSLKDTFGETAGAGIAEMLASGGRRAEEVAGLLRFIDYLSPTKGESMMPKGYERSNVGLRLMKELQSAGEQTRALSDKSGTKIERDGVITDDLKTEVTKILAGLPSDISSLIVYGALPGGQATGFGLQAGLGSYGRGDSGEEALRKGAIGFGMGALLSGTSKFTKWLAPKAANKLLTAETRAALNDPATMEAYQAAKAAGEKIKLAPDLQRAIALKGIVEKGLPLGVVTGVGYAASAIEGGSRRDNIKSALTWGILHLLGDTFGKKAGEKFTKEEIDKADEKVIRVADEKGNPRDVLLLKDEKGNLEATDVTGVVPEDVVENPKQIDGSIAKNAEKFTPKVEAGDVSESEKSPKVDMSVPPTQVEDVSIKSKNIDKSSVSPIPKSETQADKPLTSETQVSATRTRAKAKFEERMGKKGEDVASEPPTEAITAQPKAEAVKEPHELTLDEFAKDATVTRGNNYIAVKTPYDKTSFVIRSTETDKYSDADAIAKSHADYIKTANEQGKKPTAMSAKPLEAARQKAAKRVADRKARPAKNKSLSQYVRAAGGIRPNKYTKGEVRRISNRETGTTGLVNKNATKTAEQMAEQAWEAGYLRDIWPTIQDRNGDEFLEYVENDLHGIKKHHAMADYEELDRNIEQQEAEYYEKVARSEASTEAYRKERDETVAKQVDLLTDPQAQEVLANVSAKGYSVDGLDLPTNAESEQFQQLLEKHGITDNYARDILEAYETERASSESVTPNTQRIGESDTSGTAEKGVKIKGITFPESTYLTPLDRKAIRAMVEGGETQASSPRKQYKITKQDGNDLSIEITERSKRESTGQMETRTSKTTATIVPLRDSALRSVPDKGEKALRMIVGEKGLTPNDVNIKNNLDVAKQMQLAGKDGKTIWQATGWERGADLKWKYEIPDFKVRDISASLLKDAIDAKELFYKYPQLANIKLKVIPTSLFNRLKTKVVGGNYGYYRPSERTIYLREGIAGKTTLHHEVQHIIQDIEGFSLGASATNPNYHLKAGEVEARNVERRNAMSEDSRKNTSPSETEDVRRGDQVLRSVPDIINSRGEVDEKRTKDVAGRIERGELTTQRLGEAGEQGRLRGGQRNVELSALLGAGEAKHQEASRRGKQGVESRSSQIRRQENLIERYAREAGIRVDPNYLKNRTAQVGEGGEAKVYHEDGKDYVYKTIDPRAINRTTTPQEFLDRISLFNAIFPETAYTLEGITREDGKFKFVVKQPYINGGGVQQSVLEEAMRERGFEPTANKESFENSLYTVHDLHQKNAMQDADGNVFVIDAVPKAKHVSDFEVVPKDGALRSVPANKPFYSRVERTLENMPAKATPRQVEALLEKGGVKELDPEYQALKLWLADQGDSVSKKEKAQEWIDEYGDKGPTPQTVHGIRITPQMREAFEGGVPLLKLRDLETITDLENLPKKDFAEVVKGMETSVEQGTKAKNVLDLSIHAAEFTRVLYSAVMDTPLEDTATLNGLTLEPSIVAKFQDAAEGAIDALKGRGIDTTPVEKYIADFTEAAKENGLVKFKVTNEALIHEDIHEADYLGALDDTGSAKPLSVRYDGAYDILSNDDAFIRFGNRLASRQKDQPSMGIQIAEALAYLSNRDYAKFGLSKNEAKSILKTIIVGYAKENGVESLKTFDDTSLYEHIESYTKSKGSQTSDVSGGEVSGEREIEPTSAGQKPRQTVGEEAFTPGGAEKLSQTPKTMRGNVAAFNKVEDRSYTSTGNAERQDFANNILDKGVDHARNWVDQQLADDNNNAGATQAVGLSLMMHYAKNGGIDAMNEMSKRLINKGTDNAQAVQAMSIVSQFDPESAAAYASLLKQRKRGLDLTDAERKRATDIAENLDETAKVDALGQAALDDALEYNKQLKAENEAIAEALADKPKESKTDVANLKRQLTRWKNKSLGVDNTVGRVTRTHRELLNRKNDLLARLREKFPDKGAALRSIPHRTGKVTDIFDHGNFKQFDIDGQIYHERVLRDAGNDTASLKVGDSVKGFEPPAKQIGPESQRRDVDTRRLLSAFSNPVDESKVTQYAEEMANGDTFPAISGFESTIDESDVGEHFLNGDEITKEDVGQPVWKVWDGHHRALAAIKADIPTLRARVERSAITDESELKAFDAALRSTPSKSFDDQTRQDLIDYTALQILEGKSYKETIDNLSEIAADTLTEDEIKAIHANAVDSIRGERPQANMSADKLKQVREKIRIRNEHRSKAREFHGANKNPNLSRLERELLEIAPDDRVRVASLILARAPDLHTYFDTIEQAYPDITKQEKKDLYVAATNLKRQAAANLKKRAMENSRNIKLSDDDIAAIREERRVNMANARRSQKEAENFYNGLVRTKGDVSAETIVNLRRANLLTGVKTHARNVFGNIGFGTSEEAMRPVAWLGDLAASAVTGERTVQGISPVGIAKSFANIFAKDETLKNIDRDSGIKAAMNILKYGDTLDNLERQQHGESILSEKFTGKVSGKIAKGLDHYINGVFRTLGAEDALFKVYAFRRSLEEQAKVMSKDKEERKRLVTNPTQTMIMVADDFANFMTFQNDNVLSRAFTAFKKKHPVIKTIAETIVPYDRTPTNIVLRVTESLPLIGTGIAVKQALNIKSKPDTHFRNRYRGAVEADLTNEEWQNLSAEEKRKRIDEGIQKVWSREKQAKFARTFGRSSLGTGLFMSGFFLAAAGLLTGSMRPEDDDKAETDEFFKRMRTGVENKSIRIPGVGRFVLPDDPASKTLAAGATFYEQMQMNKGDAAYKAWQASKEVTYDALTEQPLLNNVGSLYTTIKKGKIGEFAGNLAGGYVPTLVSDVGEIEDEFQRTGSSYKKGEKIKTISDLATKQGRGFRNSFLKRIPLARHYADQSDTSVPQSERGGMLRRAARSIDLFNIRSDRPYKAPTQ